MLCFFKVSHVQAISYLREYASLSIGIVLWTCGGLKQEEMPVHPPHISCWALYAVGECCSSYCKHFLVVELDLIRDTRTGGSSAMIRDRTFHRTRPYEDSRMGKYNGRA